MECTRLKNWNFVGTGEKFSRLDLDSGYTDNGYPLWASLSGQSFKREDHHIGDMATLLSLITLIIIPNDRMTQTNNFLCGANHQSQSHRIANEQYTAVYMLQLN